MAEHINWKKITKAESEYLGEWDVEEDTVFTIKEAAEEIVKIPARSISRAELVITFVETPKKFVCNQTNAGRIEKALGTKYLDEWVGKKIQLYSDPHVNFGKQTVSAIRVRIKAPETGKAEYHCAVCGTIIDKEIYQKSVAKYGKAYCSKDCLDKDTKGEDLL